jgi:hypothetical protein
VVVTSVDVVVAVGVVGVVDFIVVVCVVDHSTVDRRCVVIEPSCCYQLQPCSHSNHGELTSVFLFNILWDCEYDQRQRSTRHQLQHHHNNNAVAIVAQSGDGGKNKRENQA